jgi:hypothetical protein
MCEFSRQLRAPADEVLAKGRQSIEAAGGSLTGDVERGTIRMPTPVGGVAGEYTVSGATISFRITQKPFFMPCLTIESFVDRFLFA